MRVAGPGVLHLQPERQGLPVRHRDDAGHVWTGGILQMSKGQA